MVCAGSAYLSLEDVTLLEDLLDDVLLLVSSKLVLELAVGCSVEDTSGALPDVIVSLGGVWRGSWSCRHLLVGNKDLPAADNLSKRNRLVGLPVANGLSRVDKDNVVVVASLEVDLDLGGVSSHICGVGGGSEWLVVGVDIGSWIELLMDVYDEGRKNA
jgi:hypothetical protein